MTMRTISLDPGESTGWATWEGGKLVDCGTDPLWHVVDAITVTSTPPEDYLPNLQPQLHLVAAFKGWDEIVCEDWAIYPWVAREGGLDYDSCRTARGIGAVELVCRCTGKPITLQPASIKDEAEAAGAEQLFDTPLHENRHANDAKRHGVFYFARQAPGYAPSTYDQDQAEGREADRG